MRSAAAAAARHVKGGSRRKSTQRKRKREAAAAAGDTTATETPPEDSAAGEATGSKALEPPPRAGPPPPVSSWLPELLEASHRMPMPPPRQPAGPALMDAIETFTARVLRAGNDMETLGTYSTSWADIRKKYKEASAMLHPDKQFGRDTDSQRRTALAWQKVSDAYERAELKFAPAPTGTGAAAAPENGGGTQ